MKAEATRQQGLERQPTTQRWRLTGELPCIEQALRVGERCKQSLQGVFGDRLPDALRDKDASGNPLEGHVHPSYLPEDADGDGRIDHLVLHVPGGLAPEWRPKLGLIRPAARQTGLLPRFFLLHDWLGSADEEDVPGLLLGSARRWISTTPFLANGHLKKNLSFEDKMKRELARELDRRGSAQCRDPEVRFMPHLGIAGRQVQPGAFECVRLDPEKAPPRGGYRGAFFELVFPEPISGPVAFGYSCHLGLGLFRRSVSADDKG